MEKERRRETDGGGAPSVDAGMEPSPPSHTIFFHLGPNPLFRQYVPYLQFLLLPPFLLLQRTSPLHLPLFLSSISFSSSFCSLTSSPWASVSAVRQHSDVVCLDVLFLCSRRWLDNFVDVICDLTRDNMQQGYHAAISAALNGEINILPHVHYVLHEMRERNCAAAQELTWLYRIVSVIRYKIRK